MTRTRRLCYAVGMLPLLAGCGHNSEYVSFGNVLQVMFYIGVIVFGIVVASVIAESHK